MPPQPAGGRQVAGARAFRRTHVALAILHLVEAVAILLLGGDAELPVTAAFLEGPPGGDSSFGDTTLFDLPVAPAVAAFLLLAAADHAWSAGPGRTRYEAALALGRNWRPFAYGSLAGTFPWIAISLQLAVAQTENDDVPGFLLAIVVSLLVLFMSLAVVQLLQFRTARAARDPYTAERRYNALSLVAKSALARQVYAGALAG